MITRNFDVILNQPQFYIEVGDISEFTNFQWKLNDVTSKKITAKMIRGQKCISTDNLFDEFAGVFQFPYYFGENWDAFNECMNDLEWLHSDAYVVCISNSENLLSLPVTDFEIFINIMTNTVKEWEVGRDYGAFTTPPTPFNVVFHCAEGKEMAVIEKFQELGINLERV